MWKPLKIGAGVLVWLASVIGFYIALDTWNVSPGNQSAILVGWFAAGIIAMAYYCGVQKGQQASQIIERKTLAQKSDLKEIGENNSEGSQAIISAPKVESDKRIKDQKEDLTPIQQAWIYAHQDKKEEAYKSIEEAIKLEKEPSRECVYKTLRAMIRMKFGDGNAIEELSEIIRTYPDQAYPLSMLASVYENWGNYEKAKELYLKSAELQKEASGQIDDYIMAARTMKELTRYEEAEKTLIGLLNKIESDGEKSKLFIELGDIYERAKKMEEMFCSYEKALELNPHDEELRFKIAHKYSENGLNELSLYHYNLARKSSDVLHNLGVIFSDLDMPLRSIKSYKSALTEGETLAASNMAHKLVNVGFLEEARNMLIAVKNKENVDPNVYAALSKVEKLLENDEEEEKQKRSLEKANSRRQYSIKFIEAFIDQSRQVESGLWKISDDLCIAITSAQDRKVEGFIYPTLSGVHSGLVGLGKTEHLYRLSGEIKGRAIKAKWQYHNSEKGLNSAWKAVHESGDGYLFFFEDGSKLSGYINDFTSKGNIKFIDAIRGSDDEYLSILKRIQAKIKPPQAFSA